MKARKIVTRLQTVMETIRGKISSDPKQGKRFSRIIKFFLIMVILTLVSRGTAGAIMPKVTVGEVERSTIVTELSLSGEIAVFHEESIEAYENLTIDEIYIQEGQQILEGDPLFSYDASEVDLFIRSEEAELERLQIQYEQLLASDSIDNQGILDATDNLNYALADQATSAANHAESVNKANEAIATATTQLESLQTQYDADLTTLASYEAQLTQVTNTFNKLEADEDATEEELTSAREAVVEAQSLVAEYEGRVQSGAIAIEGANTTLALAKDSLEVAQNTQTSDATLHERYVIAAQKALESAQKLYDENQSNLEDATAINKADAAILAITLEERRNELEELQQIQENDYVVSSHVQGVLTQWYITSGQVSVAKAGTIQNDFLGYAYYTSIPEAYMEHVQYGTQVIINQDYEQILGVIQTIGDQSQDGTYPVTVAIEGEQGRVGTANGVIAISEQTYETCVLSLAVRQDAQGYFLYGVEERNTILGLQNVVYRIDITIEEAGATMTAISGVVYAGDSIITYSDKIITAGDRVRIDL